MNLRVKTGETNYFGSCSISLNEFSIITLAQP